MDTGNANGLLPTSKSRSRSSRMSKASGKLLRRRKRSGNGLENSGKPVKKRHKGGIAKAAPGIRHGCGAVIGMGSQSKQTGMPQKRMATRTNVPKVWEKTLRGATNQ